MGLLPEEIARKFGHLSLAQVHAALAYYHASRAEIDADSEAEAREAEAASSVSRIKIFFDEDSMDTDLVSALRSRDGDAITASDAGLRACSDETQLAFAAQHGSVLYTRNIPDSYRLHRRPLASGREHTGAP